MDGSSSLPGATESCNNIRMLSPEEVKRVEVVSAYLEWTRIPPEACKCLTHHFGNFSYKLPDQQVCPRERAWRKYVLKRDEYLGVENADVITFRPHTPEVSNH